MNKKILAFMFIPTLFLASCFGGGQQNNDSSTLENAPMENEGYAFIDYIPCPGVEVYFSKMEGRVKDKIQINYKVIDKSKSYTLWLYQNMEKKGYGLNTRFAEDFDSLTYEMVEGKNVCKVEVNDSKDDDAYIPNPNGEHYLLNNFWATDHEFPLLTFGDEGKQVEGISSYAVDKTKVYEPLEPGKTLIRIPKEYKYLQKYAVLGCDDFLLMETEQKLETMDDDFFEGGDIVLWGVDNVIKQFGDYIYITYNKGNDVAILDYLGESDKPFHIIDEINGAKVSALLNNPFYNVISDIYIPDSVEIIQRHVFEVSHELRYSHIFIEGNDIKPGFQNGFSGGRRLRLYDEHNGPFTHVNNYNNDVFYFSTHTVNGERVAYIEGIKSAGNIIKVPTMVEDIKVTAIANFENDVVNTNIIDIEIPDGIDYIYDGAFKNITCRTLKMPNTLTKMGGRALPTITSRLIWSKGMHRVPSYTFNNSGNFQVLHGEEIQYVESYGFNNVTAENFQTMDISHINYIESRGFNACNYPGRFDKEIHYEHQAIYDGSLRYFEFTDQVDNELLNMFYNTGMTKILINRSKPTLMRHFSCSTPNIVYLYDDNNEDLIRALTFNDSNFLRVLYQHKNSFYETRWQYTQVKFIEQDNILYCIDSKDQFATVLSCNHYSEYIDIANELTLDGKTYPVKQIYSFAFTNLLQRSDRDRLINTPINLESIYTNAFYNVDAEIRLHNNLKTIHRSAFATYKDELSGEIKIPRSVQNIGYHALYHFRWVKFEASKFNENWDIKCCHPSANISYGA